MEYLNNTKKKQIDLTGTYEILNPTIEEYMFFSSAHGCSPGQTIYYYIK